MFGSALIVFREVLEAALIVGVVAAASRGVPGRSWWLLAGVLTGMVGAIAIAAGAAAISRVADGIGHEILNSAVLFAAVAMLIWHIVWMSTHGKQLAEAARQTSIDIRDGRRESMVLASLVGLAVLREGSETALFLYGMAISPDASFASMLLGGLLGIAAGVLVGVLLYIGLLRIPLHWFFKVTGVLVTLLAAGMASQATGMLIQVDLLPPLLNPVWDTSSMLPADSMLTMLLKSLIGYDPQPVGMQLIAYGAVIGLTFVCRYWVSRPQPLASPN
ncbi:MAG: FTR1 family protein [Burkholderiales bacterium]|nr:FTR1 family protein [Burkholderiales bacterium]